MSGLIFMMFASVLVQSVTGMKSGVPELRFLGSGVGNPWLNDLFDNHTAKLQL